MTKRSNILYCGLIAYSGKETFDALKLKILYLYNEMRGHDSTGLYYHGDSPISERLIKMIGGSAMEFLPNMTWGVGYCLIGHTRHGTGGAATIDNAHPFLFDQHVNHPPVIGAHNGVISNKYALNNKYNETTASLAVDSMIIFKQLQDKNDTTILSELGDDNNAVIYTNDDGILKVFKMKDKPLFRGVVMSGTEVGGMYISSIKEALEVIDCKQIKEFKADYLYSIKDGAVSTCIPIKRTPHSFPVTTGSYNRSGTNSRVADSYRANSSFDSDPEVTFRKTRWLGDKTSGDKVINSVLVDSAYEMYKDLLNQEEDLNMTAVVNNEDDDQAILENIKEVLYSIKSTIDEEVNNINTATKQMTPDLTAIDQSVESLKGASALIMDEIFYIDTGSDDLKDKIEARLKQVATV